MTLKRSDERPAPPPRPALGNPRLARRGAARPRAEPASGHGLRRPFHRARVYVALSGDRPAGLRASRDRLRARPLARRVEIAQALPQQLPQPRRLPRGLHRRDRQAPGGAARAAVSAHRRLLVPARRHADRRILADRRAAEDRVAARSGRGALPRARLIQAAAARRRAVSAIALSCSSVGPPWSAATSSSMVSSSRRSARESFSRTRSVRSATMASIEGACLAAWRA